MRKKNTQNKINYTIKRVIYIYKYTKTFNLNSERTITLKDTKTS